MVVSAEQKVELRVLSRAKMHHGEWLVEGGVTAGDRVIVGGLQKVFPGMPVQVAAGDTTASTDPLQHW
jgi:membrane fusion protein (multidrug efflux system)